MVQVALICHLILQAIKGDDQRVHLLSVDEKTGIQALEYIDSRPMEQGACRRLDPEYVRHGTTCLMAAYDVAKGSMLAHRLHPTRTEEDFAAFIQQTIDQVPEKDTIIFLLDHLNTHLSASLVELVAKRIGVTDDLGKKEARGILKNMDSRKAFLTENSHRIRFVYTPKHCSWLNPIENWFATLQRKVITHGSFLSVKELEENIEAFIQYYNSCLAKPMKWKFTGFLKAAEGVANSPVI